MGLCFSDTAGGGDEIAAATIERGEGPGGLPTITLKHASGATAQITEFGATLVSYKAASGREVLFVSGEALFNGKKAIRGGVPLVYPQFGQPDKAMAQHGFLRTSHWACAKMATAADGTARAVFALASSDATTAVYPHAFEAEYAVTLSATSLTTSLRIANTDFPGTAAVAPQLLLHTYYAVDDVGAVELRGLSGARYLDKVGGGAATADADAALRVRGETDRVYLTGGAGDALQLQICERGEPIVNVKCEASFGGPDGDVRFVPDCVAWNPWIAKSKSMGDFGDEEYKTMICVEPGILNDDRPKIAPGSEVTLTQTIEPLA